ncbi:MAG: hypothetical protein LBK73_06390 [Treponema sp.]|nr:hypothetical protein [Treponema sp.]
MELRISRKRLRSYREFLYILPFIIMVAMFAYYPLYGWFYAFFDYRPPNALSMKDFVGLKWFTYMASNPVRVQTVLAVLRNTLVMSGITLITSWLPMLFAVFLNEIKWMPYRKFVQTVTTLPNFISWVLVYSIAFNLFNSTGAVNSILQSLGVTSAPIMFLQDSKHV